MEKRFCREEAEAYMLSRLAVMRAEGKRPSVYVTTFGCQQNEADSERLYGIAMSLGYEKASSPDDASLILLNTCAIREHAELKALSVVGSYKHLKEKNPALLIGVCGCMTAQEHRVDTLKRRYPYVDFTLEPGAVAELPVALATRLSGGRRLFFLDGEDTALLPLPTERVSGHRAWVSIMYGCNNFCSYCIVPYVRGRERSRPAADIIREVEELVSSGARDITLLGQNVNSYRGECDFPTLLERLDAIEGEYVLRMMTSHPKDASDRLIEVIGKSKHIEPHFHLPLQSGSDGILKAMNRKYDTARYLSVVDKLRAARPDIAITSDIIVGFPGETEEDFADTLSILERVRFDGVYSFIYSPRKGTPAADMAEQVPPEVQSERFSRLLNLQSRISHEKNLPYENGVYRVLIDGPSKTDDRVYSGRTDSGKLVHVAAEGLTVGRFYNVKIEKAEAFALFGSIVPNEE